MQVFSSFPEQGRRKKTTKRACWLEEASLVVLLDENELVLDPCVDIADEGHLKARWSDGQASVAVLLIIHHARPGRADWLQVCSQPEPCHAWPILTRSAKGNQIFRHDSSTDHDVSGCLALSVAYLSVNWTTPLIL